VNSPYDRPIISIQTTMPTESIQPSATAPALSKPSAGTAYDSIHIPHGHPPLISSVQGQRNWNTSTNCTESSTQGSTGTLPKPSSFVTATTSRVFIGHPPSLSGYSNGTHANTSIISHKSSTTTELLTAAAATHIEIPPPPKVPLDSCSPGIWGRPGCLSTPTSFFDATSKPAGHQVQTPAVPASTLTEISPAPTVPLDSCLPGIWGRPGCLSTPTNFIDTASTLVGHQVQGSPSESVFSAVLGHTETQAFHTSHNSTAQHAQAQCTSTFYSLPTSACTRTIYASKTTVIVNCFGCVGHHALASVASDGGSVSHPHHTNLPFYTTSTNTLFPDLPKLRYGDEALDNEDNVWLPRPNHWQQQQLRGQRDEYVVDWIERCVERRLYQHCLVLSFLSFVHVQASQMSPLRCIKKHRERQCILAAGCEFGGYSVSDL
jgi:hypothetical protein